jgi:multidrug efflux system outer membrane protein
VKLPKLNRRPTCSYQQTIQTAFREVSDAPCNTESERDSRTAGTAGDNIAGPIAAGLSEYQGGVDTLLNVLVSDRELFNAELSLTQTNATSYCHW